MLKKDFMLGAATAAHQVEGNNIHSDFWELENLENSVYSEPSLEAVDHYHHYKEDLDLLKAAGLNSYRFGIEWARIEPMQGQFDIKEVQHYEELLKYCHQIGIKPIVTLHHFSSPAWLIKEVGWENKEVIHLFGKYVKYIVSQLGQYMEYICTINEANMGLQIAKKVAEMKSGLVGEVQVGLNNNKSLEITKMMGNSFLAPRTKEGDEIIIQCHEHARKIIKEISSSLKVGITFSLHDLQSVSGGEKNMKEEAEEEFLHYLPAIKDDDFFGLQNYTRRVCDEKGRIIPSQSTRKTEMGYEFYPEGLENVIRYVYEHLKLPIIITENGISTSNDEERIEFIEIALKGVENCLKDRIPVLGYMHWSLLDNFEWQLGYEQQFGLISVDRKTQKRTTKASLAYLGKYAKKL